MSCNNVKNIYSFGVQHVPKEIKNFIDNKNVIANIQTINSKICEYFCIGFIYFLFKVKKLIDFTTLFSPNNFKANGKVALNCLLTECRTIFVVSIATAIEAHVEITNASISQTNY